MDSITSPESFFGHRMGEDKKIARWDKITKYFEKLAEESDRILVENIGPSTLGNSFLKVTISSADNIKNLDRLKKISMALADPRKLSQEEIKTMVKEGKAVSVQSMSLHATEIGGTQMAPELAYNLLSGEDEATLRILDNVVFVMVPCFNPDGQLMVTDWYNEQLGTEYEGTNYPKLYHHYTGHDNNRDAVAGNIIETKYMADILFHEWMPQSYQDHHHQGSYGARIDIAPYKNPLRPYVDPLTWRELNLYGAGMAYWMDSKNLSGVSSGAHYPSWGHFGFHWMVNSHNIAGMLTESASAKLASPKFIHPTQLEGDGDNVRPTYEAQNFFPNPWPGGWWSLRDIVDRMYWAAYGLLDVMAKNKELILRNMVVKALRQTKAGEESDISAYILAEDQHDRGELIRLLEILLRQNIDVSVAAEPFSIDHATYPAGTYIVFTAQPKYGLIRTILGQTAYPDNQWTRDKDGALTAFDSATDTHSEYLGVNVIAAEKKIEGSFNRISTLPQRVQQVETAAGYILSAKENDSFCAVNLLLAGGENVWRLENCARHSFYTECNADTLNEILEKAPVSVRAVHEDVGSKTKKIKAARAALYQRYYSGNADEGWMRLVFDRQQFPYSTVTDSDIVNGKLKDYDVLILPSDEAGMLTGPKFAQDDPQMERILQWVGTQPPEYQSGLGKDGADAIRAFVEDGGKLLSINASSDYVIDIFHLPVKNVVKGLPASEFNTHGSTLHVKVDNQDKAAYGMPEEALILHWNGPVFDIIEKNFAENYKVILRFPPSGILKSGLLTGENIIASKAALVRANCKKGEILLYAFSPHWRSQTHGTFKLLFNEMYAADMH